MKARPLIINNCIPLNDIPSVPPLVKDKNIAPLISYIKPIKIRISPDGRSSVLLLKTLEGSKSRIENRINLYR